MELTDNGNSKKMTRAKRRVHELKGFYIHFMVYIVVNTFITVSKIIGNINNGETFSQAFWDFGTFAIWLFWGIGLIFHGMKVFSFNPFFSKDWEEQQIRKYIEKDKKEADKYR